MSKHGITSVTQYTKLFLMKDRVGAVIQHIYFAWWRDDGIKYCRVCKMFHPYMMRNKVGE